MEEAANNMNVFFFILFADLIGTVNFSADIYHETFQKRIASQCDIYFIRKELTCTAFFCYWSVLLETDVIVAFGGII